MRGKLRLGLSLFLFAVKQEDSEPCPPYPSMVLKGSSEITNVRHPSKVRKFSEVSVWVFSAGICQSSMFFFLALWSLVFYLMNSAEQESALSMNLMASSSEPQAWPSDQRWPCCSFESISTFPPQLTSWIVTHDCPVDCPLHMKNYFN